MNFITRYRLVPYIIIVVIGFMIYANTLQGEFIFDSASIVSDQFKRKEISSYFDVKEWNMRDRPVSNLTFSINYYFGGENVSGYHLVNIIIHILNAFLIYLLTVAFLGSRVFDDSTFSKLNPRIFALFVSLIFLVHPLQTQSVAYIIQRMTSLAAFFYLLAVYLYFKARILQVNKKRILLSAVLIILAVISGVLGLYSKQNAITFLVAFFLVELFFIRNNQNNPIQQ